MDDHEKDSSFLHRDWRAAVSGLYHRDTKSGADEKDMAAEDEEGSGRQSPSSQLSAFM